MKVSIKFVANTGCEFSIAGQLFSDPVSQVHNDDDELPEHLSDDDDDAKLTQNTKNAVDLPTPSKLKKPDLAAAGSGAAQNKRS